MVDYAYIKLWDILVGVVRWSQTDKLADFQYDKKFLEQNWDISPVKMPVSAGDRIYRFSELQMKSNFEENTFKGLPGLLADSLPDKYGNRLIETWLAQNGRAPESMNPVEKLCFIGNRGMGALEFEPARMKQNKNTFAVEMDSLIDIARKMLSDRKKFEVRISDDEKQAMREILRIGTSAGGARPKAVIAYNKKTQEIRSGQIRVPKGFEHWLIKLDGVSGIQFGSSHGWGRVEYAYSLMAGECGIQMTDCELLEENGRAHFMTRRFDREENNIKHHIQTWCSLQHYDYNNVNSYSYEQLFQTMRLLRLSYPEAEQMFRRMVFNVLAANCDDHTKNFSFRLKKGEKWELAPAYDICFSYDPNSHWVSRQTLSINGKRENFTRDDFLTIAKENRIKKAEEIIHHINETVKQWKKYARKARVNEELTEMIRKNLRTF